MSGLRSDKNVILKLIPITLLFIFSMTSAFAVVFDRLFDTLGRTFAMSETNLALLVYWILIFTIVYFVGNKSFDYFNKNGSEGRKFAIILALIMATISVVFTPNELIREVMEVYGTFILPILVLFIPGAMTIVSYSLLFKGGDRTTGKSIAAAILFFLSFFMGDYLRTVFEGVFSASNPMGATMLVLADIMLLAQIIGFLIALFSSFGGGKLGEAAQNVFNRGRNIVNNQGGNNRNNGPIIGDTKSNRPQPPESQPYDATQDIANINRNILELEQNVLAIDEQYFHVLEAREKDNLTNLQVIEQINIVIAQTVQRMHDTRNQIDQIQKNLETKNIPRNDAAQLALLADKYVELIGKSRKDAINFYSQLERGEQNE